jgi:hypothetical protein
MAQPLPMISPSSPSVSFSSAVGPKPADKVQAGITVELVESF